MAENKIESPCIGVCSINEGTGFCAGCYRTLDEIQQWWDMNPDQQKTVLHNITQREAADTQFD